MCLTNNEKYLGLLRKLHNAFPLWDELNGKTIFISGATGMIGSFLVDAIMLRNEDLPERMRSKIIAVSRKRPEAESRFARWTPYREFQFLEHDISNPFPGLDIHPDYLIHGASNSHPIAFSSDPVNTILANVLGACNMLEIAARHAGSRFLFLSSGEVYGENRGDAEYFDENYCGYLNSNTLRAGYPEGKRVGEAMCQAFIQQYRTDAVIIRLPRSYGPAMRMSDSKASAQFIKNGLAKKDIVLKSEGNQYFSYAHVSDVVQGALWVLLRGKTGEAYNLGDPQSDIRLKDLAGIVAEYSQTKVVFELPDERERKGYSTATTALLNGEKLKKLGWNPQYTIKEGICETIDILRDISDTRGVD